MGKLNLDMGDCRDSVALKLTDQVPFGKLKGYTIQHAIQSNPKYVEWLVESEMVELTQEAAELLENELSFFLDYDPREDQEMPF